MAEEGRSSWIDERGDVWLYIGGIPFFIMTADSIEESRAIAFGWDNGGTSGTWDRTSDYEGIFSGGAFGAFKILTCVIEAKI